MFTEVLKMKKFSTYIITAILMLSSVTANAAVIPRETLPLNSTETMEDKFLRIITNHPLANDGICDIMNISQMSRTA